MFELVLRGGEAPHGYVSALSPGPFRRPRKLIRGALLGSTALVAVGLGLSASPQQALAQQVRIDGGATITVPGDRASPWVTGSHVIVGRGSSGTLVIASGEVTGLTGTIAQYNGSTGLVTVTGSGSRWVSSDQMRVGQNGTGTLAIADGGAVSNTLGWIGYANATGSVTVTGGGSRWSNSGVLNVGYIFSSGTLEISDGGEVTSAGGLIAYAGSSGAVTVTGPGSLWANSGDLTVGAEDLGDGRLTIADGGSVTNTAAYIGAEAGSTGEVAVMGAGSSWTNSGGLVVGNYSDGTLAIADGGVVSNTEGYIGYAAGSTGEVTVTGADTAWTNSALLYVGNGGSGVLTIADGGAVSNTEGYIGYAAGSTGEVTVTGADSVWSNSGDLSVGASGDGALTVENGGAVSSLGGSIGNVAGSAGEVTVSGPASTWTNGIGELYVGLFGSGALTITDGGAVLSNANGWIGHNVGSTGEVTVTGAGSTWTNSGVVFVGNYGSGTLAIENGAAVSSLYGRIGENAGSTGEVSVTGEGSSWTTSFPMTVGNSGDGALTIAGGGVVTNNQGQIAFAAGITGAVTVTGAGSTWTNSDTLFVGIFGSGALTIADGGAVLSNANGWIGYAAGSTGGVTVAGAGSTWTNSGFLYIGQQGDGALTLADGAHVSSDDVIVADSIGSTGVLNIGAAAGDAAAGAGTLDAPELRFGDGAGTLVFNHTDTAYDLDIDMSGAGAIEALAGLTNLTGDSSAFSGQTNVTGGDLRVTGTLGGDVTVSGGSLGGSGSVLGAVAVGAGSLVGVQGQTLTMDTLNLSAASTVDAALGAVAPGVLFDVDGDLVLDGALNVTDLGGFGAGIYGLLTYGGGLTDNGLEVGATPAGVAAGDLAVQTSVAGQVNLVSAAGQDLLFWDGDTAALHDNGAVDGGAGTWTSGGQTWTSADGLVTSAMRPDPGFGVFMGAAGTVTVSGPDVGVTGMQFAVDGYQVEGDAVELTAAETFIRVGDGTMASAGMTATIASALTGAGQLVKTDLGTLILTGSNSYGGGVEVRQGTLIGDADSLVGDIVNDAALVFDQAAAGTFASAISGGGAAIKAGAGVLALTGANAMDWTVQTGGLTVGSAAFAGDVAVETGATFTSDPAADAVWAGVLSGSGDFGKLGGSTLNLTGASGGFDGVTSVQDGLLLVNGALGGQVIVDAGGMIGGSGQVEDLILGAGGVVAPGNSIGTLNIAGDLVIAAGSIYEVEVDPTGTASDLIAVTGTATINGGTVQHIGLPGVYGPVSSYTILTAAGGVTGTFDAVDSDFAFLEASLDYEPDAVLLLIERNDVSFAGVGHALNQQSTGDAIETGGWGAPLYSAVIGLNADNARVAFDQLSGELHGSLRSTLVEDSGQVRGMLGQRMRQTDARGVSMWAQAHGAVGHIGTDGNAAALRSRAGGLWLGAEGAVAPGMMLGVAVGADRSTHDTARAGQAERDGYRLAAYAASHWGALGLSGGVAAAWDDIETDRTAIFPGFAERLEGDYSAETIQAFAEATWTIPAGAAIIEPFASAARVRTETDGFTETGGVGALTVESQTQEVTFATLGLGARRGFDDGRGRTGALEGRLGWRHATGDLASSTDQAFAGGAAFTVDGLPVDEDALVAEIGGELTLGETLALKVDWTGQAGDHTAQRLSATLSWRF